MLPIATIIPDSTSQHYIDGLRLGFFYQSGKVEDINSKKLCIIIADKELVLDREGIIKLHYALNMFLIQQPIEDLKLYPVQANHHPLVGELAIFEEHIVILKDLDGGHELPGTCMLKKGIELPEETACRNVKNDLEHIFGGNTVRPEYYGLSGRTVRAVCRVNKKNYGLLDQITPGTVNLDDLTKLE